MHITIYVNKKNAELFKDEAEKSKLINNLLERHYFDTVSGGKTQEDVHAEIRAAQAALNSAKVPTEDRVVGFPDDKLDYESLGYVYDPLAGAIYDPNGEQVPGRADKKTNKIIELL